MKYSTLVTARRKDEIYPKHIKWLAYNKNQNLVGYLGENGQEVELEYKEDEEVTPEKIIQSLSDLIKERDELKKKINENSSKVDTTGMEKKVMVSFSIRGDEPETVYDLENKKAAEALVERNKAKYGFVEILELKEYYISWKK